MVSASLVVTVDQLRDVVHLSVAGDITAVTSEDFEAAVVDALRHGPSRVEIDLACVVEIDDEGMFALVDLHRQVTADGRTLVVQVPSHIHERLAQTLLPELVRIEDSLLA